MAEFAKRGVWEIRTSFWRRAAEAYVASSFLRRMAAVPREAGSAAEPGGCESYVRNGWDGGWVIYVRLTLAVNQCFLTCADVHLRIQ